ncbi:MAG TPA: hypothetical protein PKJ14_07590 [Candidatus Cloacimonadota bacterium]|nr:hypothetical protein [Candidatus Cloacimonadota bacterium]HQL15363.1 hypothetical protein [Candidatus Cloacimonadota bacterium]
MNRIKIIVIPSLIAILLLISACEQNKLRSGEELFQRGSYAAAIEQLDNYIQIGKNGAYITRAELTRSACYLELGLAAMDKENWNLAIRLLKLANSAEADLELAKVYNTLAHQAIDANDVPKAMEYFSLIINETSNSDLIPEIMEMRIIQFLNYYNDKEAAWSEYMQLYNLYPENEHEIAAREYVDSFIPSFIDAAVDKAVKKEYDAALEDLFEIRRYPVRNRDRIDFEISNIYQAMAEIEIQNKNYSVANDLFLKALEYYPAKKEAITKRLELIASLYLEKGNDFLKIRDFDAAYAYYNKAFEIIPDFPPAKAAINNARNIQYNILRAEQIFKQGEIAEFNRNYPEAKNLYSQAYQLDKQSEYAAKIEEMDNLIQAERNPTGFAKSIITQYRNGLLTQRIQAQKQQLLKKYKPEEIRDSGWKILLSTGQYKYEARYDLITPDESLFFVWQINLKDRSVTPLNKMSEKLMQ